MEQNQYWRVIFPNGAARVMWGTESQAREFCAANNAKYEQTK